MKSLIGVIVGIIVFLVLIFVVDKALVNLIVNAMPKSFEEYLGLIKVVSWFVILWLTFGFALFISFLIGFIIANVFN